MKLGIVLQEASTGGWRFLERLSVSLKRVFPETQIHCFFGPDVVRTFGRGPTVDCLRAAGIVVEHWTRKPTGKVAYRDQIIWKLRRGLSYRRQLEKLNQCDVAFFAWPYFIEPPPLRVPTAFIPHDFNFSHFFGSTVYRPEDAKLTRDLMMRWLRQADPVVSTRFIANELRNCFPDFESDPTVIHLSSLAELVPLPSDVASSTVARLGIQGDYVLCVNNTSHHKNLGQVLGGFHLALERYPNLRLVFCGHGTDAIRGNARSEYGLDVAFDSQPCNVTGLGLVSDEDLVALIQRSKMVINASLYEAGNGSGLDAWTLGTPVAMSEIPAFMEQLEVLGVRAVTFNPRCIHEIRDAIYGILDHPDRTRASVEESSLAMRNYNWEMIAAKYHQFFQRIARTIPAERRSRA